MLPMTPKAPVVNEKKSKLGEESARLCTKCICAR